MRIGFSTGCLHRSNIPKGELIEFYYSLGANAIELSFSNPSYLNDFELSSETICNIKKYDYISIHAPWHEITYKPDEKTNDIIEKLRCLCDKIPVEGIVLHPDTVDDFRYLENSKLPFLFENMDKRKKFGTHPQHFLQLIKNYSFGFVLDLQHSYENDSTMKFAREFVSIFGNRLKAIHVSGCTKSERHFPVYIADNRDAIAQILELSINVPKILEGVLLENIPQTASKELDFVRKYGKGGSN